MGFRVADAVGLVWSHPIVSVGVLLLFTPPLFPVVVYFSPLLISTALVVLAMISMGSDVDEAPSYMPDTDYKRGWIEDEAADDGPLLDGERVPKRLKASSKDEGWFGMVKNWEGTGRAWVESVLSQESRRSGEGFNSDDSYAAIEDSIPPLETTREVLIKEEETKPDGTPESDKSKDLPIVSSADVSVIPAQHSEIVADDGAPESSKETAGLIEITSAPKSEDQSHLLKIPRSIVPPVPLLKLRSLFKLDKKAGEGLVTEKNVVPKDIKSLPIKVDQEAEKDSAVNDKDSENRNIASASISGADRDPIASVGELANVESTSTEPDVEERPAVTAEVTKPVSTQRESTVSSLEPENVTEGVSKEMNSVSMDAPSGEAGLNIPVPGEVDGAPEAAKTPQPREMKSAAELLAPLRQGNSYGLGTPSAAVALSEKLKVPLEDIMSLLAGDDKENIPDEGPAGKGSSSDTTTSQEEEWSSSDEESPAPFKSDEAQSAKKDL